jgi:hypothetical protein
MKKEPNAEELLRQMDALLNRLTTPAKKNAASVTPLRRADTAVPPKPSFATPMKQPTPTRAQSPQSPMAVSVQKVPDSASAKAKSIGISAKAPELPPKSPVNPQLISHPELTSKLLDMTASLQRLSARHVPASPPKMHPGRNIAASSKVYGTVQPAPLYEGNDSQQELSTQDQVRVGFSLAKLQLKVLRLVRKYKAIKHPVAPTVAVPSTTTNTTRQPELAAIDVDGSAARNTLRPGRHIDRWPFPPSVEVFSAESSSEAPRKYVPRQRARDPEALLAAFTTRSVEDMPLNTYGGKATRTQRLRSVSPTFGLANAIPRSGTFGAGPRDPYGSTLFRVEPHARTPLPPPDTFAGFG